MAELLRRPGPLLLRDVEVESARTDVLVRDGRVARTGSGLEADGADVVDGRGGALLPGLHDHHVHLLATAAAAASVDCSASSVRDRAGLAAALSGTGAVRGVGYTEDVGAGT
ncbi:MAG: amidohydrolase, partial [Frankiales bacterium]|nr:amidohydrolase [Frankiales bacterium]